jgi:methionyl-tRNA formyltransferase
LSELGAAALIEAIDGIAAGKLAARPQPADGASYAPKIDKSEARLDWNATAAELDRRVRAFNPWPMAETRFAGESLRVIRAAVADGAADDAAPGTLLGIAEDGLRVACGAGVLAVRELQRAGKRPVSARDFANAVRLDGTRFGT